MSHYVVHVISGTEEYWDEYDSWEDVAFDYPDLDHDTYPGCSFTFDDGDAVITISSEEDFDAACSF